MRDFERDPWALVLGGSSGMGVAAARKLGATDEAAWIDGALIACHGGERLG
jgi:NAD(P)-dependent dehydrogenase (short-subunit alcohol dehydrogenase family)